MKIRIEVSADNLKELSVVDEGLETVLRVVASNPQTPEQLLEAVSDSKCSSVRKEIASNPSATLETLDKLIHDSDPEVRAAIAQHPQAINFLWKLVADPNPLVRYCVAMNQQFPEHVYQMLANDENERVARRALRTLRALANRESLMVCIMDRLTKNKLAS